MSTKIFAYNQGSRSARALGEALGARVLRREGSTWRPRAGSDNVVINWGSSTVPPFANTRVLNNAAAVALCGNKLSFFRHANERLLQGFIPDWTESRTQAQLMSDAGHKVVCRTVLTGHSGNGIIIVEPGQQVPQAPLYTKYQKKTAEYRVHLGRLRGGGVGTIDFQRKVRDPDREPTDWNVRSHQNGFIYIRNSRDGTPLTMPDRVFEAAREVFNASGLSFGAVDVIYHQSGTTEPGRAWVLEINTAPGLEGTTVTNYNNFIRENFL